MKPRLSLIPWELPSIKGTTEVAHLRPFKSTVSHWLCTAHHQSPSSHPGGMQPPEVEAIFFIPGTSLVKGDIQELLAANIHSR